MIKYSAEAERRQLFLKEKGFYRGPVDGLFGEKSKVAEQRYLESVGKLSQPSRKMTLGGHQEEFSLDLGKLLIFAYKKGYRVRMGDVWSKEEYRDKRGRRVHIPGSSHHKKLAADINLFIRGRWLERTEEHMELGRYWESLSPYNRWGGNYNDGNHYERLEYLWR